jgi:hypothetical protein
MNNNISSRYETRLKHTRRRSAPVETSRDAGVFELIETK